MQLLASEPPSSSAASRVIGTQQLGVSKLKLVLANALASLSPL